MLRLGGSHTALVNTMRLSPLLPSAASHPISFLLARMAGMTGAFLVRNADITRYKRWVVKKERRSAAQSSAAQRRAGAEWVRYPLVQAKHCRGPRMALTLSSRMTAGV